MRRILKFIPKGSIVLAATSFASYLLGLARDHFFAQTFGASRSLDAYNAAFLFPDLLFNILIAGGIAAAFVPIFTGLLKKDETRANEYANSVITAATGTMCFTAIFVIVFATPMSRLVAPGFGPEDRLLVVKILRVLAFSPILFAASNALGAILVARRRFLFYGVSPVAYNLGIIGGTLILVPQFGIMGVAYGTLAGAALHLFARTFDIWRTGFHFKPDFSFGTADFRRTIKLMLPKMLGHPIELATFWGFTAIASMLSPGSIVVMNFSRNFQSVPVSLIGITIATTTFPLLAGTATEKEAQNFRAVLKKSFLAIGFLSVLAAAFMYIIREPLIRTFLGGGEFRADDIRQTAAVLGIFCLSIPTESLIHLLARAFYATKNTAVPVAVSVLGIAIAIPAGYFLSRSWGVAALPFAFFLASALELLVLAILLPRRLKRMR
jgi:putative peptidoglycan lipid II flippase